MQMSVDVKLLCGKLVKNFVMESERWFDIDFSNMVMVNMLIFSIQIQWNTRKIYGLNYSQNSYE